MAACRGCGATLDPRNVFADLGTAPLANALLSEDDLERPEVYHRLVALVCQTCLLVQLPETPSPRDIFTDSYPFRSGASRAWGDHCRAFADSAIKRLGLGPGSRVLEIGSNDGTALRRFQEHSIDAMGVEPCRVVAEEALRAGLATDIAFWTKDYARKLRSGDYRADLIFATNVLAHVPDLSDFLWGVYAALTDDGTAVFEVPHVTELISSHHWDQIYHEHHCYFSLHSLKAALTRCNLGAVDVESIPTHGGSMRVWVKRGGTRQGSPLVDFFWNSERAAGYHDTEVYRAFASVPPKDKRTALSTLLACGRAIGYGASAKAVTLLNYCGIGPELIPAIVDTTAAKQGKILPGSRIPIVAPEAVTEDPDTVVNFIWNWREESEQNIRASWPNTKIVYPTENLIACASS